MNSKKFFDVFPTLKLDQKKTALFSEVDVERITSTKKKDFLRIYISSDHILKKDAVYAVEHEIRKQLFPANDITIKIYERFHLSAQYTPETFVENYMGSMLTEFKMYSPILYNMLKNADFQYPAEQTAVVTVEDNVICRSKIDEFVQILEKILVERGGFSLQISIHYKEGKADRHREEEDQLDRKIAEISGRTDAEKADLSSGGSKQKEMTGTGKERKGKAFGGKPEETKNALKRSDNPDVVYGKDFDEDSMPMEEIQGEIGSVVIKGKVISFESREIKNEKMILIFSLTDFTDTMSIKMFIRNDQLEEISSDIKPGAFLKIKGVAVLDKFDSELTVGAIVGVKKIPDFTVSRSDHSPKKRVELHCHTKMSDMDGVSEAKDLVKRAYQWGHPAIAITDHGVVQAFPDANHVWEDLWRSEKERERKEKEKTRRPLPISRIFLK